MKDHRRTGERESEQNSRDEESRLEACHEPVLRSARGAGGGAARPLEALVGLREVREGAVERLGTLVDAVAQQVVGRLVEVRREHGRAGHCLNGDVDDVILESATIWESGGVPAEHAPAVALAE